MENYEQLVKDARAMDKVTAVPVDYLGNRIGVGDIVVKACMSGRSPTLELRRITRVEGKDVWSQVLPEGKPTKLRYTSRLLLVDKK